MYICTYMYDISVVYHLHILGVCHGNSVCPCTFMLHLEPDIITIIFKQKIEYLTYLQTFDRVNEIPREYKGTEYHR